MCAGVGADGCAFASACDCAEGRGLGPGSPDPQEVFLGRVKHRIRTCGRLTGGRAPLGKPNRQCHRCQLATLGFKVLTLRSCCMTLRARLTCLILCLVAVTEVCGSFASASSKSGSKRPDQSPRSGTSTCLDKSPINCQNAFLRGQDLHGRDLTGANFTHANLVDTDLFGASLMRANLSGATLSDANLTQADFTDGNLQGGNFFHADLSYATLNGASLTGASLIGANLTGSYLTNANLTNANLTGAVVRSYLTNANLTNANLDDASFFYANLTNANLTEANLTGANLDDANLTEANLTGAKFCRTTMVNGRRKSTRC